MIVLSKNCCTPISFWMGITLRELSRWIYANNEVIQKQNETKESKK